MLEPKYERKGPRMGIVIFLFSIGWPMEGDMRIAQVL